MVAGRTSEPGPAAFLWIAAASPCRELAVARRWAGGLARVLDAASAAAAVADPPDEFRDRSPAAILVAAATGFSPLLDECVALSRRWPLAPVVTVAASLVDGRRRSGPPLPGVEEVAWNELPGRLAWWLRTRAGGLSGGLGMPATSRRDERILEASLRIATHPPGRTCRVEVAGTRAADAEALSDLVRAAGHVVVASRVGRPPVDHRADVVAWDAGILGAPQITWLEMLAANRPHAPVILLDSFPRADTASAASESGAVVVLSRPTSLESLSGGLLLAAARLPGPSCG